MTTLTGSVSNLAKTQFEAFAQSLATAPNAQAELDAIGVALDMAFAPGSLSAQEVSLSSTQYVVALYNPQGTQIGTATYSGSNFITTGGIGNPLVANDFFGVNSHLTGVNLANMAGYTVFSYSGDVNIIAMSGNETTNGYVNVTEVRVGSSGLGTEMVVSGNLTVSVSSGTSAMLSGTISSVTMYVRNGAEAYKLTISGSLAPSASLVQDVFGDITSTTSNLTGEINSISLDRYTYSDNAGQMQSGTSNLITATNLQLDPTDLDALMFAMSSEVGPDMSFGTGGLVTTTPVALDDFSSPVYTTEDDIAQELTMLSGGKFLVTGTTGQPFGPQNGFAAAVYNANGTLDTAFDTDGIFTTGVLGGVASLGDVAVLSDGRVLMAGGVDGSTVLARFGTTGLDLSFNTADLDPGTAVLPGGGDARAMAVKNGASVAQDLIYTAGDNFLLHRFDSDGNLDTSFATNGTAMPALPYGSITTTDMVMDQATGKFYVVGAAASGIVVARFDANGVLDATFGSGGRQLVSLTSAMAGEVAVQSDGKIVVVGSAFSFSNFSTDIAVARLTTGGSLDPTFAGTGVLTFGGFNTERGQSVSIDAAGQILVGSYSSSGNVSLSRLSSTGTLLWTSDTPVANSTSAGSAQVEALADGSVLVVGTGPGDPGHGLDWQIGRVVDSELTRNQVLVAGDDSINFTGTELGVELYGFTGNDSIVGGSGNDTLEGGAGNDTIDGAGGDFDQLSFAHATSGITLTFSNAAGSATDTVTVSGFGTDVVSGIEEIGGTPFADSLTGASGTNESFNGYAGNDTINGGVGGSDWVSYDGSFGVAVNLSATSASAASGSAPDGSAVVTAVYEGSSVPGTDTLTNIENVRGSEFNDTIRGDAANNILWGMAGNDVISGRGGSDTLDGGSNTPSGDLVDYYGSSTAINATLAAGVIIQGSTTDTVSNFENILGTAHNDTMVGAAPTRYFRLDDPFESFEGMDGADIIDGGSSAPTFYASVSYSRVPTGFTVTSGVQVNLATGVVTGFWGNDTLSNIDQVIGTGLADSLVGGSSSSQIIATNLFEAFMGGSGSDTIDGAGGRDRVRYDSTGFNPGHVVVTLGNGNGTAVEYAADNVTAVSTDTLISIEDVWGSQFNDTFNGDNFNNWFEGLGGADTIHGGNGFDQLRFQRSTVAVSASFTGAGTGTAFDGMPFGASVTSMDTFDGIEELYGSDFDDTLTGGNFNDNFVGMAGNDSINGGSGFDRASYSAGPTGASVSVDMALGTVVDQWGNTDTLISIESIQGTHFADTITADAGKLLTYQLTDFGQTMEGLSGNDTLSGGSSAPSVLAIVTYLNSPSAVTVNLATGSATDGFGGTDTLTHIDGVIGSAFADSITGGSASSQIIAANHFEQFEGGLGNDTIDGGEGSDRVMYGNASASVTVTLADGDAAGTATGGDGTDTLYHIEQIRGSNFADMLTGNSGNNVFEGLGGSDTIGGGTSGFDQLRYSRSPAAINATFTGSGTGTVIDGFGATDSFTGIDEIFASDFNDTLTGGSGDDSFLGMTGNDTLNGGAGNDRAAYNTGPIGVGVTVNLGAGTATDNWGNTDTLISIENIQGSHSADVLTGDGNANRIEGLSGNDTINGGDGTDVAFYNGLQANYTVTSLGGGIYTVASADGTDTLTSIEQVQFTDATQNLEGGGGPSTLTWSALANGAEVAFDPAVDTLSIDGGVSARDIDLSPIESGPNSGRGVILRQYDPADPSMQTLKAVTLLFTPGSDASNPFKVSSSHISFTNGSKLLVGDDLVSTGDDDSTATLTGSVGNDLLISVGGTQTLNAGDGDDVLFTAERQSSAGSTGADVLNGGSGNDWLGLGQATVSTITQFTVNLATGQGSVTGAFPSNFTLSGIENVNGSDVADLVTGDANPNMLAGRSGNDTLLGGAGNDWLAGGAGSDSLDGGDGRDMVDLALDVGTAVNLTVTSASSGTVVQGGNTDTVANIEFFGGTGGNDTMTGDARLLNYLLSDQPLQFEGNGGNDTINGGSSAPSSFAIASYGFSASAVNVNLGTGVATDGNGGTDSLSNIDAVVGSIYGDVLTGGSSSSQILSGNLFEQFEGGLGNDTIDGLGGGDRVVYQNASSSVTVTLADGDAAGTATGGDGNDTLFHIEQIRGSAHADTLTGNNGNNVIEGMAGNDTISGLGGFDQLRYSRSTAAINVTFTGNSAGTVVDGLGGTDNFTGMEEIYGSDFADTMTGGSANDFFMGMAGNDTINGGGGFDRASYVTGPVGSALTINMALGTVVDQYGGTDTLISIESIQGTHFADTLLADGNRLLTYQITDFAQTLEGMGGNDTINGGAGGPSVLVTASYVSSGAAVNVNLGTGIATDGFGSTDTLINIDNVVGSAFADVLTGGSSSSQIIASNLLEQFEGGLGNDTIDGLGGTDRVLYGNATSAVTVTLADGDAAGTATGGDGTDTLYHIEQIRGSAHADTLTGNGGSNSIEGLGGSDTINGGNGFDQARYSRSTSAISVTFSAPGAGTVTDGLGGTDTLTSIEEIFASDYNDTLNGGSGDDSFLGMTGNDTLNGGDGVDWASYTTGPIGSAVTVNLATGFATDNWGGIDTLISIESARGSHFNDVLVGDGGANRLQGMGGNDTLSGGLGSDTAVFNGVRAGYSIVKTGPGSFIVTDLDFNDGNDGVDTLNGMEFAQFSDLTANLVPKPKLMADFGNDGHADILWRNTQSGAIYMFEMNGDTIVDQGFVVSGVPTGWHVIDSRSDFGGDGNSDLLWWNVETRSAYLFQMNGTAVVSEGFISQNVPAGWEIVETRGDFNGDGKNDILWQHSADHSTYVFLMDGNAVIGEGFERSGIGLEWNIQESEGDYNNDGNSDILWRNANSGALYIDFLSGASRSSEGMLLPIGPEGWEIKEAKADYNGDGNSDILWWNPTTHSVYAFLLDGLGIASQGYVAQGIPPGWEIIGTRGDYNNDGRADLFWKNTENATYIFLMDGTSIIGEGFERQGIGPGWNVVDSAGDYGGDGYSDILWNNQNTGDVYLDQVQGTGIVSEGFVAFGVPSAWSIVV